MSESASSTTGNSWHTKSNKSQHFTLLLACTTLAVMIIGLSSCDSLDGLHDLILALELLLVLKAVRVLSFSGITNHYTTDICLCLMTRGQQRSAQI